MTTIAASSAKNEGIALTAIFIKGPSLTTAAANRLIPTGGVMKPTDNVQTTNTPKWIGSNPSSTPIGNKIGMTTRIAAIGSRMHPIIKSDNIIRATEPT